MNSTGEPWTHRRPEVAFSSMMTSLGPLLALYVVAILLRLVAISATDFDGLYGQDPFAYYQFAEQMRAALMSGQRPPPFFWPMGYPFLVALSMMGLGVLPAAGQGVSVITGALLAPLTYWMVRALQPSAGFGAWVAGLLAAVAGQLMLSSIVVMADTASLLWATFSAATMIVFLRNLKTRWLLLAATLLAAAVLTRWVYGLLALPWAISALLAWRRAGFGWRRQWRDAAIVTAAGLLIFALHFLPDLGRSNLSYVGDLQVYSWDPANALRSVVSNPDGQFSYERPIGLYYALPFVHPSYVAPLFTPFLLLGIIWLLKHKTASVAAVVLGWPLVVYLFLAGVTWQNWRFPLSYFPSLLLLVGLGLQWLWLWGRGEVRSNKGKEGLFWLRPALVILCVAGLLGSLLWAARDVRQFTSWKASQLSAVHWTTSLLPPGATLLAFGLTLTLDHYSDFEIVEIFELEEEALQGYAGSGAPLYLLIDVGNVESQWRGRSPSLVYHHLQDNFGLREVGRHAPYTLFAVGAEVQERAP